MFFFSDIKTTQFRQSSLFIGLFHCERYLSFESWFMNEVSNCPCFRNFWFICNYLFFIIQVISTARTCNCIIIVLDAIKPITHKRLIEKELEGFGIRYLGFWVILYRAVSSSLVFFLQLSNCLAKCYLEYMNSVVGAAGAWKTGSINIIIILKCILLMKLCKQYEMSQQNQNYKTTNQNRTDVILLVYLAVCDLL